VSVNVTNAGDVAGAEVVQLYVADETASVVLPPKMLKAFERVCLEPGQSRRVEFALQPRDMAVLDAGMKWTVEPGRFRAIIGPGDALAASDFEIRT
jgi:beta-glucosidase